MDRVGWGDSVDRSHCSTWNRETPAYWATGRCYERVSSGCHDLRPVTGFRVWIAKSFYQKNDFHIHIPEGAVPKDGPSAGITMAVALVSALTKTSLRHDIAMTGELTLTGKVLPIGGLKEKVLAAHRHGIHKLIIPIENEKDIPDIPENIRKSIQFFPVTKMDEVIKHSFGKNNKTKKKPAPRKTKRASKTSTKQPALRLN